MRVAECLKCPLFLDFVVYKMYHQRHDYTSYLKTNQPMNATAKHHTLLVGNSRCEWGGALPSIACHTGMCHPTGRAMVYLNAKFINRVWTFCLATVIHRVRRYPSPIARRYFFPHFLQSTDHCHSTIQVIDGLEKGRARIFCHTVSVSRNRVSKARRAA